MVMGKTYKRKSKLKSRSKKQRLQRVVIAKPQKNILSRSPLFTSLKTTLRYYDNVAINPGAGTAGSHVFIANGMYDPDFTGTGHQPRGFDQIMALYDHFVVIGSKITCYFYNTGTTNLTCGIILRDVTTALTDSDDIMESRYVTSRPLGHRLSGGGTTTIVSAQANVNKFLGRPAPLSDPELKGDIAANPQEQASWHVFAFDPYGGDPGQVAVDVTIEFTAVFIEPKQPPKS